MPSGSLSTKQVLKSVQFPLPSSSRPMIPIEARLPEATGHPVTVMRPHSSSHRGQEASVAQGRFVDAQLSLPPLLLCMMPAGLSSAFPGLPAAQAVHGGIKLGQEQQGRNGKCSTSTEVRRRICSHSAPSAAFLWTPGVLRESPPLSGGLEGQGQSRDSTLPFRPLHVHPGRPQGQPSGPGTPLLGLGLGTCRSGSSRES